MHLTTKRLAMAEVIALDIDDVHRLHSMPEVDEFNTLGIPVSINDTEALVTSWLLQRQAAPRMHFTLAIRLLANNQFIGLLGLNLGKSNFKNSEVWYKLHPSYWRKGYATEALSRILNYAFAELELHRIEAGCAVDNIASIKVLERVGMIREGRKRQVLPIRGNWVDNYFYAILKSDISHRQ